MLNVEIVSSVFDDTQKLYAQSRSSFKLLTNQGQGCVRDVAG